MMFTVSILKYLGIVLNYQLQWNSHISHVSKASYYLYTGLMVITKWCFKITNWFISVLFGFACMGPCLCQWNFGSENFNPRTNIFWSPFENIGPDNINFFISWVLWSNFLKMLVSLKILVLLKFWFSASLSHYRIRKKFVVDLISWFLWITKIHEFLQGGETDYYVHRKSTRISGDILIFLIVRTCALYIS